VLLLDVGRLDVFLRQRGWTQSVGAGGGVMPLALQQQHEGRTVMGMVDLSAWLVDPDMRQELCACGVLLLGVERL
jgi:hypothetical protein